MDTYKKIVIYYFSATGNSLKAASVIASGYYQSELIKISRKVITEHPDSVNVGFVFPVYMGGIPKIVENFLKNFPFKKDVYYFSVATYYKYKGSALSVVNHILENKGAQLDYGNYIPTVGNCLKEYEVTADKRPIILELADTITEKIAGDILNKIKIQQPSHCAISEKLHKGIFHIFFKDTHKKFSLEDNCMGCGICSKVCPVGNIVLKDGKPQWNINCEACHACIHWCPRNAINLGKSKGRLQYHHPDIKIAGLLF